MAKSTRTWVVPTNTIRLKAVRLVRKHVREGHSLSKARLMVSKIVGYSVSSIISWENQFPLKNKLKTGTTRRTTTVVHSHKKPTKKTTTSTSLNGIVVNHNLNANTDDKFRVLSVDLMVNDGNIITITKESLENITRLFG